MDGVAAAEVLAVGPGALAAGAPGLAAGDDASAAGALAGARSAEGVGSLAVVVGAARPKIAYAPPPTAAMTTAPPRTTGHRLGALRTLALRGGACPSDGVGLLDSAPSTGRLSTDCPSEGMLAEESWLGSAARKALMRART
jgi:hypothetical protein